jgi:hypothetical protein
MRRMSFAIMFLLLALCLRASSVVSSSDSSGFQAQISRAVNYLVNRFNPTINLIYESDDPGKHWLAREFKDFKWQYRQTYWLYSDNLFAAYALQPFRPEISARIQSALNRYQIPPSGLFEAVIGDQVLTIRNAVDYIIESSPEFVVVARRHDSSILSYGLYADLICYRALQLFLQGRINEAHRSFRQAGSLWSGKGLDDWSYTIVDGFYSNQKLALLLYTSKVLAMNFAAFTEMEYHLWGMQQDDGGLAALSDSEGRPMGSSNAETTSLALLIYNESLIRFIQSKSNAQEKPLWGFCVVSLLFSLVTAGSFFKLGTSKKHRSAVRS